MSHATHLSLESLFTAAHHEYEKRLRLHALYKVHDPAACDDLVQDTFLKMWAYIARGGKIEGMKAFLYHVLNNLIVDEYRKHKTLSLESVIQKGYEPRSDLTNRLIDILDGSVALTYIDKLPTLYQGVMRMRYSEGLTLKEMASRTHQSRNTVAVQLHRGLSKLRRLYFQNNALRIGR